MQNIKWGLAAAAAALVISVLMGIISGVGAFYIFLRALIFTFVFFGIGLGLRFAVNSFFPEILFTDNESEKQAEEPPGARINITLDSKGEYAVPELYKKPDGSNELGNINDLTSGAYRNGNKRKSGAKQSSNQWMDDDSDTGVFLADDDSSPFGAIDLKNKGGYNETGGGGFQFQDLDGGDSSPFVLDDGSGFESFSSTEAKKPFKEPSFTPSLEDSSELGGLPDLDMMARSFSGAPSSSPPAAPPAGSSAADNAGAERDRNSGDKPKVLEGDYNPKDIARGISTLLNKD